MDDSPTTLTALRRLRRALLLPREKPASSQRTTLIIVGIFIAAIVVVTAIILGVLHLRRRRLDRREDARHAHELGDFDGDDVVMPQPPDLRKPDGAVVPGSNGRVPGGERRPQYGGPGFDQFASSAESVSGPPLQKRGSDPFVDKPAGGRRG